MSETPSSSAANGGSVVSSASRSGAKRPRSAMSLIEFDGQDVMQALEVDDSYMVLGIDEAGRGPVIGSMVYTGSMISIAEHDKLITECHVADSKMLDEAHRDSALLQLERLKTLQSFTVCVSADEISAAMTGRHGRNLNTLSHDTAIHIISQATLAACGKLCAVYIDTVGPPEFYQNKLAGRFPHLRITVAKKADSKYPIVSAASIVAKTTRDASIAKLGLDVGSGYPSDPKAMNWVRHHLHRFFVFDESHTHLVRHSWGPVAALANDPSVCVPITFQQDHETEEKKRGDQVQPRLTFVKPPPRRHATYTHLLRLKVVDGFQS